MIRYNQKRKGKVITIMTKKQFILNIIFFLPLLILNFFAYGIEGDIRLIKMLQKYSKKYLTHS